MNKLGMTVITVASVCAAAITSGAEEAVSRTEFDALKAKMESLEQAATVAETSSDKWYDNLELALGATGLLQGSSGAGELSDDGDKTDASASIDLELTAHATENGALYLHLESGSGDGLDGDIATLSGLNDDADDDANVRLTEVWYEHTFGNLVRLRVGKVDLTTDFDTNAVANSETDQFLSSGFVNGLAAEFPDDNGFGGMLWLSPSSLVDIGFGIADADADWDNAFEDPFAIAEVDFKPLIGGLQGNYRFFGWYNGKDHENLTDGSTDEHNYGFGLSFDQQVNDSVTLFARYGWQRGEVSKVEHAWSAGFALSGATFGRENDNIGFAYGRAMIGDDWKNFDSASGVDYADEGHFEVFYNYAVNEHLALSPDIQWVTNANGDKGGDDFFVFGLRTQVSF